MINKLKEHLKNKLLTLAFYTAAMVYLELCLHIIVYGCADIRIVFPLLFAIMAGILIFTVSSLLPKKASVITGLILISVVIIYFEVQLVYNCIFGSFMPLKQLTMGADAVTGFFSQTLHAIGNNILKIIILILPLPVGIFLFAKKKITHIQLNRYQAAGSAVAFLLTWGVVSLILLTCGSYSMLTNPNAATDSSVKHFGVFATSFQETKALILPETKAGFKLDNTKEPKDIDLGAGDIDFAALALTTDNTDLADIDNYLAGVAPLPHNEYTGIAKGYNLITICAEAFSPHLIDPELMPTLYKLSNSGLVFNNFYNCFPNTTTNGEYTMCMGLMPDMSRNKIESSFNESADNYLPLCLGNIYTAMGYKAYGYHNYYATFYDRHVTHTNMGYDFRAILNGLDMEVGNPSSDLDMIETSMKDYINSTEPFHVYYMTYSGHYQYNWDNEMSAKNRDKVKDLPYSEEVKAYIACQLELEYALAALTKGLEKSGQADNTVIVLSGDHFPYGLTGNQFDELVGEEVDKNFEKFRNSFICYIPGIEKVEVDSYCSTPDILPTVLNIMGIEYDSRLLAGSDVMADIPHMAILSDHSFIAEEMRYNASTDEVIYNGKENEELFEYYRNRTDNIFTLSSAILENDYYAHAFNYDGGADKPKITNFSDITNEEVYIEATVTFMVDKGFMEPITDTVFGKDKPGTIKEFIEVLYRMAGNPKGYDDACEWALKNGLATEKELKSKKAGRYGQIAAIIHRASALPHLPKDLDELKKEYPDIKPNELVGLSFCLENGIVLGNKEKNSYELCDEHLTRYHIAAFLQRVYMKDLI